MNSFNFIEARTFVPLLTYKLTQWVDLGFYSAEIFPTLYTSTQPVQTCVCQANLFSREIVSMHNLVLFGSVGCGHWVVFFSGLWLFGNANGCLLYCPCNICLPFRWLVSWSFGTRDLTKQIKGFQRTDCMNTSIPIVNTLIFPVSSLTSKLSLLVCFNNETNL